MRKELNFSEKAAIFIVAAATAVGLKAGLSPKAVAEESPITTEAGQTLKSTTAEARRFSDVFPSNPYFIPIKDLAEKGIIDGFKDGTFRPDDPITRQQYIKMVVKALKIPVSEADVSTFTDVERSGPELSFDNYIAAAKTAGLVEGITTKIFAPNEIMTKKQAITVFMRELKKNYPDYLGSSPSNYEVFFEQPIVDIQLPSQDEPNGLIVMLGPELRAQEQLSRGGAALSVYNLFIKMISAFQ